MKSTSANAGKLKAKIENKNIWQRACGNVHGDLLGVQQNNNE
jgi:hypothetical protein